MAIYHLSVKPISRKDGRSATAAAAYRAAEKIHDLTSDQVFDYTRKRGVEHAEIVLPTEAAKRDINWARDRQALWNAAEASENRSNSRVAREYEIALPHELNRAQRVELVRAFSKDLADRYGIGVDFAIHAPHRHGDERNHHAHVLTTTRTIEAGGLGAKSEIEWSDGNRRKAGLGPAKEEITLIRERWETLTNDYLKEHGIKARIDHRSLEAQGIEREPQSHLGPAVSGMERRGIETEVGKRLDAEALAAAQQRLERAAEIGKIERERAEVEKSILDLSGDVGSARRGREGIESSAAELSLLAAKPTLEEIRAEGRRRWLQERERQATEQKPLTLEEIRRQGREEWLKIRAEMAREPTPATPAASPSIDNAHSLERERGEPKPEESPQLLTLEQMKAQGRDVIENAKRELQAERLREQQRQLELEKRRELDLAKGRGKGRGLGPGPGRDGPDMEM